MDNLSRGVINAFISLTEGVVDSKTNVLDSSNEEMTSYRGEIHIIEMIRNYLDISSSEVARRFGTTRAVVHKTLLKLEEREPVTKAQDDMDKKRAPLFLIEKGRQAYPFHEGYHSRYDKALLEYMDGLSQSELETVKKFLEHVNNLIENYV